VSRHDFGRGLAHSREEIVQLGGERPPKIELLVPQRGEESIVGASSKGENPRTRVHRLDRRLLHVHVHTRTRVREHRVNRGEGERLVGTAQKTSFSRYTLNSSNRLSALTSMGPRLLRSIPPGSCVTAFLLSPNSGPSVQPSRPSSVKA
jgi:hypothetical protein